VARTSILKVRIGTTLAALIQESGGFTSPPSRIITNGLITGTAIQDLSTPITKTTKSVHIMDKESCPDYTVHDCIHCGRCLQVCPVYIDPMELVEVIKNKKIRQKHIRSIESCQHCGCCTMVCPSRIPLHHILKNAREAGFREEDK
jgi:electron transport complex protein RnfC